MADEHFRIEKMVNGGLALARTNDGVVFVDGALPGELVSCRFTGRKRGGSFAVVEAVFEQSPHRIDPMCPLSGVCGGCDWQHVDYSFQIDVKARILRENLFRVGKLTESWVPAIRTVTANEWGYRSRVQFHRDGSRVGFRARKSADVVSVPRCPVAHETINRWLADPGGEIPDGRFVVFGTDDSVWVEGRDATATARVGARDLTFQTGAFFQTNIPLLSVVVEQMRTLAARIELAGARLIDLYAGSGVFGVLLSDQFVETICVEKDRRNARSISKNGSGISALSTVESSAETYLATVAGPESDWARTMVIVDPPRKGLSAGVRKRLLHLLPEWIVYLSCDSASLGRDLGDLSRAYHATEAFLVDFYPHTSHIETLVFLRRAK